LGIIINQSSFLTGLRLTTSTNSAILNTLIPVFTLLIVTLRGIEKVTVKRLIGFAFALTGVLIIRKVENFTLSDQTFVGDMLNIVNCLSYSLFLSYSKKFLEKYDPVWSITWLFAYGSVGLTLISIPDWVALNIPELTPRLLACMAFAVFGGTLATYFLNTWALVYAKSSSVALFIYLQPVVASLLAWIWLDEPITLRAIFSSGLIFVGFFFALVLENKKIENVHEPVKI
jgi:drug/metabolite transporter (DMT)-like permease